MKTVGNNKPDAAAEALRELIRSIVREELPSALAAALSRSQAAFSAEKLPAALAGEKIPAAPSNLFSLFSDGALPERTCTREQACEALGISPSTFYRLHRKGAFRLYKKGRRVLADASAIDALLASGRFGK